MNKVRFLSIVLVLVTVLVVPGLGFAGGPSGESDLPAAPPGPQGQTDFVFVTFADPPVASYDGGIPGLPPTKPGKGHLDPNSPASRAYVRHLARVHQRFLDWLRSNADQVTVVGEYFYTLNGYALQLNGALPGWIRRGTGVKNVEYSSLFKPAMNASVVLIGADQLWPLAGGRENAGAGIKAGIIDSGIDDTHPFFACKSDIPHKVYYSGNAGDPNDLLANPHGTHVAGTVAGCVTTAPIVGTISGIAPAAQLYDYNVFPGFGYGFNHDGSALSHDIADAIEAAVVDGMDVINLSLAGGVQGPHDMLAEAVNAAVDAGTVAAVAAGNGGPGRMTVASPGSAEKAITAGATGNSHFFGVGVNVTSGSGTATYGGAVGAFDPFAATPATGQGLVDWAATGDPVTACNPATNPAPIAGKIALIQRGTCSFTTKVRNAQNAGAFGVLIYNNANGTPIPMAQDGTTPVPTIPAVMLSNVDGAAILSSLPATATIDGTVIGDYFGPPDVIASFSARGPVPFTYIIKPDLTAPGVNVYSSVFDAGWEMYQGTSMATPHVAGSVALLLQLHPGWTPADVKSALVNNAARVVDDGFGNDPGVLARGGGRIALVPAHQTPLTLDPSNASFGFWNGNRYVRDELSVAVKNVSGVEQSCTVVVTGDPILTAEPADLVVPAGESTSLMLTLDAGTGNQTPTGDYDGDVVITCGGAELKMPWYTRIDREAKP